MKDYPQAKHIENTQINLKQLTILIIIVYRANVVSEKKSYSTEFDWYTKKATAICDEQEEKMDQMSWDH